MYKYSSSDGVSSQMAGLSVKDPPNSSQQSTVDSVSHLNFVHFLNKQLKSKQNLFVTFI